MGLYLFASQGCYEVILKLKNSRKAKPSTLASSL